MIMTACLAVWCDRCGLELITRAAGVSSCGCPRCGAKHVEVCELAPPAPRPLLMIVGRGRVQALADLARV